MLSEVKFGCHLHKDDVEDHQILLGSDLMVLYLV